MQALTEKPQEQDRILFTEEVAEILRLCPKTIRRMIKRKEISHFDKIGNVYRFSMRDHVMPFLKRREQLAKWQEEKAE